MRARTWRRAGIAVTAMALVASLAPPAMASGSFFDDDGNPHEGAIEAILAIGVAMGCEDYRYCPDEPVTRAQMATFLTRAFALPATGVDFFTDDGGTHEDSINRIAAAGITGGFADGSFRPEGLVTREQLATFLARSLGLQAATEDRFTDVSGVHAGNVTAVAERGITLGCDTAGERFCPHDPVRRDHMASFLARALELEVTEVPLGGTDPAFERCVIDGIAQRAELLSPEWVVGEYEPQAVVAQIDAARLRSRGVDNLDQAPAPTYMADDVLDELGIEHSYQLVQGRTIALNLDCETLVDEFAPTADEAPGHLYLGIGVAVDAKTAFRYQVFYHLTIVQT